jgi:hypothetical protein
MNFAGIEKAAPLDHWRPRYRWASQHTHSGHRPQMALLGLAENVEPVYLVGASNSGFTDPLQMTGISLQIATQAMLLTAPRLDYLVVARILADLADEVGPLAMSLEEQTLKAARAGSPRPKRQEEAEALRTRPALRRRLEEIAGKDFAPWQIEQAAVNQYLWSMHSSEARREAAKPNAILSRLGDVAEVNEPACSWRTAKPSESRQNATSNIS